MNNINKTVGGNWHFELWNLISEWGDTKDTEPVAVKIDEHIQEALQQTRTEALEEAKKLALKWMDSRNDKFYYQKEFATLLNNNKE